MQKLAGKTAVVTGGGTGIGAELGRQLAAAGMNVILASRNTEQLEQTAENIRAEGGTVSTQRCDVTDRESVQELLDFGVRTYGGVDLLCANAGVTTAGAFHDHRPEDWNWVYDVVLGGVANCVQVFYPYMIECGSGHISLTGSQAGLVPNWIFEHGPYTSAKSAVMALGSALRIEGAELGVEVSVFIPAGVSTSIMKSEQARDAKYGDSLESTVRPRNVRRIEPDEAARRAIDGIRINAPFTASHPELRQLTADYFDTILDGFRD